MQRSHISAAKPKSVSHNVFVFDLFRSMRVVNASVTWQRPSKWKKFRLELFRPTRRIWIMMKERRTNKIEESLQRAVTNAIQKTRYVLDFTCIPYGYQWLSLFQQRLRLLFMLKMRMLSIILLLSLLIINQLKSLSSRLTKESPEIRDLKIRIVA